MTRKEESNLLPHEIIPEKILEYYDIKLRTEEYATAVIEDGRYVKIVMKRRLKAERMDMDEKTGDKDL
jgi:hypothetical protein